MSVNTTYQGVRGEMIEPDDFDIPDYDPSAELLTNTPRKNTPPSKAWILVRFEVDMEGWDDDVDWSAPDKVIRDQIDMVGIREACGTQQGTLLKIGWDD